MIIVDSALQKLHAEGNPIKAAIVGAGYIDHGIDLQILKFLKGIELVAISILMLMGSGQYQYGSTLNRYLVETSLIDFSSIVKDNDQTELNDDCGKKQKNIVSLYCNIKQPHRNSHKFNITLITSFDLFEYNHSDHQPRDPPIV